MNLAQPAWLVLLVLLPLLGVAAVFAARFRSKQWNIFVAPRLRSRLLVAGNPMPRWFALFFLLTACAAIIAALARPQGDLGTRTEKSLGRNVLVALDLSKSMRVRDVKPDRLAQAKTVIYELLEAMPNERIGIIGFAGNSYVYAPLTVDHSAVRETVEQIDETWAPVGGSDLASAVSLAIDTLKKTGQKNNALVIISDGEEHDGDLDEMITEAERFGVYILAIGVGTEDGDFIPNPDFPGNKMVDRQGKPVISRLHAAVMRKLASETKGRYAVAGSGMDIPSMVKSVIEDLDAFELEGRERRISIEFYQWLLLPAILFLFAAIVSATRWKKIQAAPLALLILALPQPSARADSVGSAKRALEEKNYPQARAAYAKLAAETRSADRKARFELGAATAAYRGGDFKHARSSYSRALLSQDPDIAASAHLGLGNALFQLGWLGLTDENYPDEPGKLPDLARFDELVKQRLEKIRSDAEEDPEGNSGYTRIESLVTNWVDAVRHFDSAAAAKSSETSARHNRDMTTTYLQRLMELLEEDKQATEDSMPQEQPQPGQGKPDEQDGEPKDPQENGEDPKASGDQKDDEQDPKDASGEDDPEEKEGPGKKQKDEKESEKEPDDPNETPEERARRLLKENADLEKGPLTPGRRELRLPEKDW